MATTTQLPTFAEIADMRCQEAAPGTKTINIKVAINTARMMVEREDRVLNILKRIHGGLRSRPGVTYEAWLEQALNDAEEVL